MTYLIRQDFTQDLPLRTNDEMIPVEEAQRDENGKFSPEIEQQVFSRDFDAVVDMNTELDLGMATLVQKSGAPLRIGFSGKYSHLFYNVEIQKPGRNFILEGAYRDIQRLLLLDS